MVTAAAFAASRPSMPFCARCPAPAASCSAMRSGRIRRPRSPIARRHSYERARFPHEGGRSGVTTSDPSTWKLPRLRIDPNGDWFHEDEEVTHDGILASLRAALQVDTTGHFIQIGTVRVPVEVADAPFTVVRLEPDGEGFTLTLNDLTRESLVPASLRLGAGEVPYGRVKEGRFLGRFSRAAAWQLLQHVEAGPADAPATIRVGGRTYALGS